MIRPRPVVFAAIAGGVLLFPAGASAHLAYVDAETGSGTACEQADPCATIAQGIATVETGLAVIVDDSATPYSESVMLGDGKSLLAQDFVAEPGAGSTQWTIDGGAASAVGVAASGAGTISGFTLRGDSNAVVAQGPVNISGNTFDDSAQSANGDLEVLGPGPVSITLNSFTDEDTVGTDAAIRIADDGPASLNRNKVSGYTTGVAVDDATGSVTLFGDLVTANGTGLALSDPPPTGPGQGDVTATNLTLASNATDISSMDADLTLDSSIVEDAITTIGSATCAIIFSRGPTTTPGGDGCQGFQTAAAAGFVGGANFHLAASSAMIDAGNSEPPAVSTDIDGDPRAVDGDGVCPAARDIGADEFVPPSPLDCSPPPPPPPSPQPAPAGDTAAPETVIEGGPSGKTKSKSASFSFSASEPGSTFECKLDSGTFEVCTSPKSYSGLKKGSHTVRVRALDLSGNVDPTPASRDWTVKKRKKKK